VCLIALAGCVVCVEIAGQGARACERGGALGGYDRVGHVCVCARVYRRHDELACKTGLECVLCLLKSVFTVAMNCQITDSEINVDNKRTITCC
jgi:hypothetical protein